MCGFLDYSSNSFQVIYRCPGEASPRTETFKSKDEALLRDMQIKLAKKNGTFEPPVKVAKGAVRIKQEVTIGDFLMNMWRFTA